MPLLRTPQGTIVSVPDEESDTAQAAGYTRVDVAQAGAVAAAPASEDRGVLGGINAAATGLLAGATLGGSDYLLKGLLNQGAGERLAQEREGHPIAAGIGQVAGAILPAIAAPESLLGRAPSGLVSHATAEAVTAGRAIGGAEGLARQLVAGGIEGAVQNAGMYLSDTALGDRELSAEGLAASLGPGFAFGVAGGVAALGIEQGTIAARRLFSRAAGTDKAAEAAQSAWAAHYQSTLEANDAAADIARAKLAEARGAREQAALAKQQAVAQQAEVKARTMPDIAPAPGAPRPVAEPPTPRPIEIAGLLHDKAMAAADPAKLAAWHAANGPRLAELMRSTAMSPLTLEEGVGAAVKSTTAPLDELDSILAMSPEQQALNQRAILSKAAEEEMAAALVEHDADRAAFEDILRRLEAPAIEPGVSSRAVPISEFGEPGQRGALGTPGPHEPVKMSPTGELPPLPLAGDKTSAFDSKDLGLTFDPKTRTYHDANRAAAEEAKFAPREDVTSMHERPAEPVPASEVRPTVERDREFVFNEDDGPDMPPVLPDSDKFRQMDWEGHDAMRRDLKGRLTKDEIASSTSYAGTIRYRDINKSLRSGAVHKEEKLWIEDLDKILSTKGLTEKPIRVFRGLGLESGADDARKLWESIKPGDSFVDKAYTSTTASFKYADDIGKVTLAIDVPAGYPAAALPSLGDESEIVLRRGTKYRVLGTYDAGDGKIIAHVRVEPSELPSYADLAAGAPRPKAGSPIEIQRAGQAPAGTDSLTGQLRSMQSRLGAGEGLNELGAPARAEYAAAKSERTAAASEHFRAKANAANYAGSPMGAAERAAQGEAMAFHEPVGDLDAFFRDLTAPKTRDAYVAANIGRAMREEGSHAAALARVEREWAAHSAAEAWAERAATLEYDGGYSRADAERLASDEMVGMPHGPELESARSNPKRVEAARKAAAASVERRREIHSAVASNLPQELQTAWNKDGHKFLQQEAPRIRGMKDRINASSKISEAFTEQYGSGAETLRGYEGDRYRRRAEIESKHAESWANEQERKYYAAHQREWAGHPVSTKAVPDAVEDVAAIAEAATKYEQSSARLTEALGPDAPPAAQEAAKAFREAEEHAERKTMERTTRAIDDHAESAPKQAVTRRGGKSAVAADEAAPDWLEEAKRLGGQVRSTPAEQRARFEMRKNVGLGMAREDILKADASLAKAKVAESEARIGARNADDFAAKSRAAAEAARPAPAGPGPTSTLGAIATTIGVAGELGVPGIPHPHDIPVIGPLLGTYLKYRAIKAAAGRFVGRIPATGDARAAALVAKTKDKIATAVDRTLGLAAEMAPKARGALVATSAALGHRLIDDGEPDAPKGANAQQQAAVRIREIANAATQPELVTRMVRKEMRGVADPDLIAAAEQHLLARFEALNRVMPKAPPPNPYSKREWVPSPAAAHDVAQRLAVVHNPEAAFVDTTPAKAETLRDAWPRLLQFAQQRLIERVGDIEHPVPYNDRLRNSLLFSVPLDDSMQPDHAAVLQSAHAPSPAAQPPQAPGGAMPSIAGNSNLTALYQTGSDRRAMR